MSFEKEEEANSDDPRKDNIRREKYIYASEPAWTVFLSCNTVYLFPTESRNYFSGIFRCNEDMNKYDFLI